MRVANEIFAIKKRFLIKWLRYSSYVGRSSPTGINVFKPYRLLIIDIGYRINYILRTSENFIFIFRIPTGRQWYRKPNNILLLVKIIELNMILYYIFIRIEWFIIILHVTYFFVNDYGDSGLLDEPNKKFFSAKTEPFLLPGIVFQTPTW